MKRFDSILVCVDVVSLSVPLGEPLPRHVASLIDHVRWVQELSGAQLTVMAVLPDEADAELVTVASDRLKTQLLPLLAESGAKVEVRVGFPFREIIKQVLGDGHDLVMLAARRQGLLHRNIVGGTALKLLRKCPCPVWVVPRNFDQRPLTVLSAAGLHGITGRILDLSASLVALTKGRWHVLHCMEFPKEGLMRMQNKSAEEIAEYRAEARDAAFQRMHELADPIAKQAGIEPKFWLAQGNVDEEVIKAEAQLSVDVMVMGTMGREGVPGMLIGNTAEQVLRLVECSVLAVKPDSFVSPVTLEN